MPKYPPETTQSLRVSRKNHQANGQRVEFADARGRFIRISFFAAYSNNKFVYKMLTPLLASISLANMLLVIAEQKKSIKKPLVWSSLCPPSKLTWWRSSKWQIGESKRWIHKSKATDQDFKQNCWPVDTFHLFALQSTYPTWILKTGNICKMNSRIVKMYKKGLFSFEWSLQWTINRQWGFWSLYRSFTHSACAHRSLEKQLYEEVQQNRQLSKEFDILKEALEEKKV